MTHSAISLKNTCETLKISHSVCYVEQNEIPCVPCLDFVPRFTINDKSQHSSIGNNKSISIKKLLINFISPCHHSMAETHGLLTMGGGRNKPDKILHFYALHFPLRLPPFPFMHKHVAIVTMKRILKLNAFLPFLQLFLLWIQEMLVLKENSLK